MDHNAAVKSGFRPIDQKAVDFTQRKLDIYKRHPLVEVIKEFEVYKHTINCKSEDGRLKSVLVSPPTYLDWDHSNPINANEATHARPDRLKATQEWFGLIDKLLSQGVKVTVLEPGESRKEGLYTRDIAFAIDSKLFVSNMLERSRKGEVALIKGAIELMALGDHDPIIEGGNVVLGNGDSVFLGIGRRTNMEAAEFLQCELGTSREVVPVLLRDNGGYDYELHLDCAFFPIERNGSHPTAAFLYPSGLAGAKEVEKITSRYPNVVELTAEEHKHLGLNMLKLDKYTFFVHKYADRLSRILRQMGIKPIKHDFSLMVDGGGSIRCFTMPYEREG